MLFGDVRWLKISILLLLGMKYMFFSFLMLLFPFKSGFSQAWSQAPWGAT